MGASRRQTSGSADKSDGSIMHKYSNVGAFNFSDIDITELLESIDSSIEVEVTEIYRVKPTSKQVVLQSVSFDFSKLEIERIQPAT